MKPMLFNTDMVRAILDGRKTCTRRVVKPQPTNTDYCQHDMVTFDRMLPDYYRGDYSCACRKCGYGVMHNGKSAYQPPYKPGDILYVRETWAMILNEYAYKCGYADNADSLPDGVKLVEPKWRPSIHMPREAARIFLRVTDVRVERLQDITEDGARSEGCFHGPLLEDSDFEVPALYSFQPVWDRTIKKSELETYGWDANPWVWVIEFERCEKPEEADHEAENRVGH